MSVTEYKRRRKRTYILIGAMLVIVPAGAVCTGLGVRCGQYKKQNEVLKKESQEFMYVTAVVLMKPVSSGERIEEDMLAEVTVCARNLQGAGAVSKKNLVGTYAKGNFDKGTFMSRACVYEEEEYSSDTRRKTFDFMELNPMTQSGDYVDVRITYPNGEDYIVASHKQVQIVSHGEEAQGDRQQNAQVSMEVTEEEILRIASAYVDSVQYPGTAIYAVSYLDQFQQPGCVDYPVNVDVFELLGWNPNAIGYEVSQQEQERRRRVEDNLSAEKRADIQQAVMENTDSF